MWRVLRTRAVILVWDFVMTETHQAWKIWYLLQPRHIKATMSKRCGDLDLSGLENIIDVGKRCWDQDFGFYRESCCSLPCSSDIINYHNIPPLLIMFLTLSITLLLGQLMVTTMRLTVYRVNNMACMDRTAGTATTSP